MIHNAAGADALTAAVLTTTGLSLFQSSSGLRYDGVLEFHLRGTLQYSVFDDAPVYLLPSLGGSGAMLSVPRGVDVNLNSASLGFQVGPSPLRAFVEHGWTWGQGTVGDALGYGVVFRIPPRSVYLGARKKAVRYAAGVAVHTVLSVLNVAFVIAGSDHGFYTGMSFESVGL